MMSRHALGGGSTYTSLKKVFYRFIVQTVEDSCRLSVHTTRRDTRLAGPTSSRLSCYYASYSYDNYCITYDVLLSTTLSLHARTCCRVHHKLRAPENTTDEKRRPGEQRPPVLSVIAVISYRLQPVNFYIAQIFAAVKAVLKYRY